MKRVCVKTYELSTCSLPGKQRLARAIPRENNLYRRQKENQAIAQLLLICGSYLLGYLPLCGKKKRCF